MDVVVMAAGSARRFGESSPPKHLVDFAGEPLLGRLVRLWASHFDAVTVIVPPERVELYRVVEQPGVTYRPRVEPPGPNALKFREALRASADGTDTMIVYGDVFFTAAAVAQIAKHAVGSEVRFFCRPGPSLITGRAHGEIFSVMVPAAERQRFSESVERVAEDYAAGRIWRDGGWEIAKHLSGVPIDQNRDYPWLPIYHVIDDLTDDIDYQSDYADLLGLIPSSSDEAIEDVAALMALVAKVMVHYGLTSIDDAPGAGVSRFIERAQQALIGDEGVTAIPERRGLESEVTRLTSEIDKLHRSTSWRITAPLRRVSDAWWRLRRRGSD